MAPPRCVRCGGCTIVGVPSDIVFAPDFDGVANSAIQIQSFAGAAAPNLRHDSKWARRVSRVAAKRQIALRRALIFVCGK